MTDFQYWWTGVFILCFIYFTYEVIVAIIEEKNKK